MDEAFQNKTAKILVVHGSANVRSLFSSELRAIGFKDVRGTNSLEDALAVMEVEDIDWLITALASDEVINAMQILKMTIKEPKLREVKLTLLLDEEERWILDAAFALGLLSWQQKGTTKEIIGRGFQELAATLQLYQSNLAAVAGDYLRRHLQSSNRIHLLTRLEERLNEIFPATPVLMLKLGAADLASGQVERAKRILSQAAWLDSSLTDAVNELLESHQLPKVPGEAAGPAQNLLGIKSAVVVDSNVNALELQKAALARLGIPEIQGFSNPVVAWSYLKTHAEPDLIVHEWELPAIPGPIFMQKIRNHGFYAVPIVVTSQTLRVEDFAITKEMGVTNVILKPLETGLFIRQIVWTIQQERLPTEPKILEAKIRLLLAARRVDMAEALMAELASKSSVPVHRLQLLEAEFAYFRGRFNRCTKFALDALKAAGATVHSLNLLGKGLMQLRNFEAALRCFEAAQDLSPLNVARLCDIAKSQIEIGAGDTAKATLKEAQELDHSSNIVLETETEMAILEGSTEAAQRLMEEMSSIANIMAFLNNRGVALSRSGRIDEGISMYKQAMQSLPKDREVEKGMIQYNLALAHVRKGDNDSALSLLEKMPGTGKSRVGDKADSLKKRVLESRTTGVSVKLRETSPEEVAKNEVEGDDAQEPLYLMARKIKELLEVRPGTMRCFQIFREESPNSQAEKMMQELPRFQPRAARTGEKSAAKEGTA